MVEAREEVHRYLQKDLLLRRDRGIPFPLEGGLNSCSQSIHELRSFSIDVGTRYPDKHWLVRELLGCVFLNVLRWISLPEISSCARVIFGLLRKVCADNSKMTFYGPSDSGNVRSTSLACAQDVLNCVFGISLGIYPAKFYRLFGAQYYLYSTLTNG